MQNFNNIVSSMAMAGHRQRDAKNLGYTDKLDCDIQITAEESIAALISNFVEGYSHTEHGYTLTDEDCADLCKQILKQVLAQFRPDLMEQRRDDNGRI